MKRLRNPVSFTREGESAGFRHCPLKEEELEALKQAARQLEKLLVSQGVTEDEMLSDFRALREK